MYQALYRKYRPQTFDDVVGQMAVTQTLKNQINTGKLSHAYLFTGTRGTGKTSSAKILAKAVNCLNPQNGNPCNCCEACRAIDSGSCMDVLEIDAASNNGVDNVRTLRDDAVYTPSQVKKRVYIIDEVHMLTLPAFNALLKIIEEPPEHLLFILATTELHKVPATILSRCQRFTFRRISQEEIASRLQYVAYQENIDLTSDAARILARLADGGMRDALSLLDQCASATSGELSAQRVYRCLGIADSVDCAHLMEAVAAHDTKSALTQLNQIYAQGKDMAALLDELACLTRDIMILKTAPKEGISLLSGVAPDEAVHKLVSALSYGELVRMLNLIQQTAAGFTRSASRRMDTELCLMNLCQPELSLDVGSLNARLSRLEERIKNGAFVTATNSGAEEADVPEPPETEETLPDVPEAPEVPQSEAPVGFWTDLTARVRKELQDRPTVFGFFAPNPAAPVQGVLKGNTLVLMCDGAFTVEVVSKPDILALVGRSAGSLLGRPVRAVAVDKTSAADVNAQFRQLLEFGKAHPDIVTIQE